MKIFALFIIIGFLSVMTWSCSGEKDYEHFPEGGNPSGGVTPEVPETLATIAFTDTVVTVLKNTRKIELPLVISEKLAASTKVAIKIMNTEGGVSGTDFWVPDNMVLIEKDTLKGCVNVVLADDGKVNEDWNFTVELSQVSGNPAPARIGRAMRCHVQVSSNTFVSFGKIELTTSEKTNQMEALQIPIKVIGELKESVTIKIASKTLELSNAAQEGVNYEIVTPEITLEAGATSGIVKVKTLNNHLDDGVNIAEIEITEVSGGNTTIGRANQRCRINIENDNYSLQFKDKTVASNEYDGTLTLSLRSSVKAASATNVTVKTIEGSAAEGVNFAIENKTVSISANSDVSSALTVTLLPDNKVRESQIFKVVLASCNDEWATLSDAECEVTVTNGDLPKWGTATTYSLEESSGDQTIKIDLAEAVECDVKLEFTATGATADKHFSVGEVTIPKRASSHSFTIKMLADPLSEPPTFDLKVTKANGLTASEPAKVSTIKMLSCTYRKLIGDWTFSSKAYNNTGIVSFSEAVKVSMAKSEDFGKVLICTGKLREGWGFTWQIRLDSQQKTFYVPCKEVVCPNVGFSPRGDVVFAQGDVGNRLYGTIPLTFDGKVLTWNLGGNGFLIGDICTLNTTTSDGRMWFKYGDVKMTKTNP